MSNQPPQIIDVKTPSMGGKVWLLESKGLFVLEGNAGVLRTIACTHAGSGSLVAIDGVPDEKGFFPDQGMTEPVMPILRAEDDKDSHVHQMNEYIEAEKKYQTRNGRPIYRANPVVMGSWMLDAGFLHGLTIKVDGGGISVAAIASIVWMPFIDRSIKK